MTYTNCYIYTVVPPDDEQQASLKHVEVNYLNKLKVNSASCWFLLYGFITMHGQQNIKFRRYNFERNQLLFLQLEMLSDVGLSRG
jgi:uncharacterized protein YjiS (DUF1127 family)